MAFVPSLFAHGKWKKCCSLRDTLNGNVTAFNVYRRRHSDVIKIKLTFGTHYNILSKTHISDFCLYPFSFLLENQCHVYIYTYLLSSRYAESLSSWLGFFVSLPVRRNFLRRCRWDSFAISAEDGYIKLRLSTCRNVTRSYVISTRSSGRIYKRTTDEVDRLLSSQLWTVRA